MKKGKNDEIRRKAIDAVNVSQTHIITTKMAFHEPSRKAIKLGAPDRT